MNFRMLSILAVCSLSLLFACEQPDSPSASNKNYSVSVSPESINVSSDASELTLAVTSDCSWNIAAEDKSWISLSRSGGTRGETSVIVKISKNDLAKARETLLVIRYGTSKRTSVPVHQEANPETAKIPTPEGYTLVWNDEFDESSDGLPLTSKWWYETAEPGWVNNELQTYIAGRKGDIVTADVSDGTLKIRAIKDGNRIYSARINTTSNWTYGYFEARLKLPKGKGTWPAFWMMPSVWSGWPDGGEIDIMEHVGCVPTEVSSSIHCKSYYHAINTQKTAARKVPGVMDEFHTYALEWTETYIKTYVDGEVLFYYNPDDYPQGRTANTWPFNKPFELKLNLAWGGDWGGMYGVDESALPATYEIDYVRVFQKQ